MSWEVSTVTGVDRVRLWWNMPTLGVLLWWIGHLLNRQRIWKRRFAKGRAAVQKSNEELIAIRKTRQALQGVPRRTVTILPMRDTLAAYAMVM